MCPPAYQVWALSPFPTTPKAFPTDSLLENIHYLLANEKSGHGDSAFKTSFVWLLWYNWKARNDKLFNERLWEPPDVLALALKEASEWHYAHLSIHRPQRSVVVRNEILLEGELVCSVDGSWKQEDRFSGLGWILHDSHGKVILMGSRGVFRGLSALDTELLSLLWAMRSVMRTNYRCHNFMTDSQQLIDMVSNPSDWPAFTAELTDVANYRRLFPEVNFSYVPRQSNHRADFLARHARKRNRSFSFLGSCLPHWISRSSSLVF